MKLQKLILREKGEKERHQSLLKRLKMKSMHYIELKLKVGFY
jgi:hypothetical protein